MGKKKVKRTKPTFPFFLLSKPTSPAAVVWRWPPYYCSQQPRTLSFRSTFSSAVDNQISTTAEQSLIKESVLDGPSDGPGSRPRDPDPCDESAAVESVIRGLKSKSDRLFFSPGETSSSILQYGGGGSFSGEMAVAVAVDSRDPVVDFRNSMEEMVEALGLKDWESMEKLLNCYLKVNEEGNHGYVVGAFVDLLVGLAFSDRTTTAGDKMGSNKKRPCSSCSPSSSPLSLFTHFSSPSSSEDSPATPCTCVCSSVAYLEAEFGDNDGISTVCAASF
ncbi:Transcription repressor OFP15 [Linum perenne]